VRRLPLEELRQSRIAELVELRKQGRKVVGWFYPGAPVEIVRAAGAVPVRLARGGYPAEARGLRWLRADACPFVLSTLGNFESDPLFRLVDAVLSVNTSDMMRRTGEAIAGQFGLPVFELYLPRTSEPLPHRVAEFERQLGRLAEELAAFTGFEVTEERLRIEIARETDVRRLIARFDALRGADASPVSETDVLDLSALATLLDPDRFLQEHRSYEAHMSDGPGLSRPRLMLAGSIVTEQDRWLVEAIEERADIVADSFVSAEPEAPAAATALASLATYYFGRIPDITRRPNDRTVALLVRRARERRAQAVLYKTLLYCDPWDFEVPRIRSALGLPMLHIDGNYSDENRGQVLTRIEAFLESLEA
jgi:benzoyl-CoA reductase/2-hydroxyglutaryl-CoA dehydratase subunit BcrC/BadD/HgdB